MALANDRRISTEGKHEMLLYGFSIIYAMKYDPNWQFYVERIKTLLQSSSRSYDNKNCKRVNENSVELPTESVITILEYCDAVSLVRSSSTCKLWFVLGNDDKRWEMLCLKDFNINSKCFSNGTSAKELYKVSSSRFRDLLKAKPMSLFFPAKISRVFLQFT